MEAGEDVVPYLAAGTNWLLREGVSMGGGVRQSGVCRLFQYVRA